MDSNRRKQPQSELESNNSDWESLKFWSANCSSVNLTYLIEREALPTTVQHTVQHTVQQTEVNSSTKPFLSLIFGLTLCLILYSLGLITLSKNIHSHTQRQDSNPNKIELGLTE